MSRRIKLIWDFFGPRAEAIAVHHQKHLDEFAAQHDLLGVESGAEPESASHWMAWLIVDESRVEQVRASLRPQRGLEA